MPRFCPEGLVLVLTALLVSSCSSRMDTNPDRLGAVRVNGGAQPKQCDPGGSDGASNHMEAGAVGGPSMHEGDMATMEAVSNGCLKAWRKACAGDEKGSLAMLDDLDKHYPGVLTIQMMTGQVYEHFGRNKEAAEHYQRAVTGNEFSSFHVFKLAEAMRKNGDYKGAEAAYRKVLKSAPEFGAADIGLARCLLQADKQSSEARQLLSKAEQDEQSAREAKALLGQIEPGAAAGN